MLRILKIILTLSILTIVASFDWNALTGETLKSNKNKIYRLHSLSAENGSVATFNGFREEDFKFFTIQILILEEDNDDSKIHEFIQKYYKIKEQQNHIFVHLCLCVKAPNTLVSFIAFDPALNSNELKDLESLDYNSLTGAEVWDYVNPTIHPGEDDQLFNFVLERQIPAKESIKNVEGVFYMATVDRIKDRTIKNISTVVIIPFHPDNTQFLKNEFERFNDKNAKKVKKDRSILRFTKNGFINGRSTSFLAIQNGIETFKNTLIDGLTTAFIAYTNFDGKEISLTPWERIQMNGEKKSPHFQSLHLRDYSQDPKVDWGLFNSTIKPLNSTDDREIFNVKLKVLLLPRGTKDRILCGEYDKMNDEKEKYQFLCYCDEAKIGIKRVAFVAYKLLNDVVDECHSLLENFADNDERNHFKRKRHYSNSTEKLEPEFKKRI